MPKKKLVAWWTLHTTTFLLSPSLLWKIGIKATLIIGSSGCTASDNLKEKIYKDREEKVGRDKTTKGDRRPSVDINLFFFALLRRQFVKKFSFFFAMVCDRMTMAT